MSRGEDGYSGKRRYERHDDGLQEPGAKRKTIIPCSFFLRGHCNKGLSCSFSHDPDVVAAAQGSTDVSIQPNSNSKHYKMFLCKYYANGRCSRGGLCSYAHGLDEFRGSVSDIDAGTLQSLGGSASMLATQLGMEQAAAAAQMQLIQQAQMAYGQQAQMAQVQQAIDMHQSAEFASQQVEQMEQMQQMQLLQLQKQTLLQQQLELQALQDRDRAMHAAARSSMPAAKPEMTDQQKFYAWSTIWQLKIVLDNSHGQRLGIDIDYSDMEAILVQNVQPQGLVAEWNAQHPDEQIARGDKIMVVNSAAIGIQAMLQELKVPQMLNLVVTKAGAPPPPPPAPPALPFGDATNIFACTASALSGTPGMATSSTALPMGMMSFLNPALTHLALPAAPSLIPPFTDPGAIPNFPVPASASSASKQYTVEIDKTQGERMGVDVTPVGEALMISAVHDGTLFGAWNGAHPDRVVVTGDRILVVNDKRGNGLELYEELKKNQKHSLTLERAGTEAPMSITANALLGVSGTMPALGTPPPPPLTTAGALLGTAGILPALNPGVASSSMLNSGVPQLGPMPGVLGGEQDMLAAFQLQQTQLAELQQVQAMQAMFQLQQMQKDQQAFPQFIVPPSQSTVSNGQQGLPQGVGNPFPLGVS